MPQPSRCGPRSPPRRINPAKLKQISVGTLAFIPKSSYKALAPSTRVISCRPFRSREVPDAFRPQDLQPVPSRLAVDRVCFGMDHPRHYSGSGAPAPSAANVVICFVSARGEIGGIGCRRGLWRGHRGGIAGVPGGACHHARLFATNARPGTPASPGHSEQLTYVVCDLSDPSWPRAVQGPFDLAVSAIALHNLRDLEKIFACYRAIHNV